jgi:hypothetical protein
MAGLRLVGGDSPCPAAGDRPEPDVILGYEGDELVVKMREAEVSGRSHRLILGRAGGRAAGHRRLRYRRKGERKLTVQ